MVEWRNLRADRLQPDGTGCTTGDCSASPDSNCSAGVGGSNPATIAEFTLQTQANDFYDITLINGANRGGNAPDCRAYRHAGSVSKAYWCKTPGAKIWQRGECDWDFIKYTGNVHYPEGEVHSYTPFLMSSSKPCSTANTPNGCPANYTCTGARRMLPAVYPGGTACPGSLECLPAQDGKDYCQCGKEAQCSGKGYCGTQFIPGLGIYLQQCGSFDGWWSADDFCGAYPNAQIGLLNCGDLITDGDGTSQTSLASLFTCAAKGGNSAGNTTSCYNDDTAQTYPQNLLRMRYLRSEQSGRADELWSENGTSRCAEVSGKAGNDVVWDSQIQPWLVNLKRACPTAYSYPYDYSTSTFQCRGTSTTNMLGYHVLFLNLPSPLTGE